jgi:hypothetical protein
MAQPHSTSLQPSLILPLAQFFFRFRLRALVLLRAHACDSGFEATPQSGLLRAIERLAIFHY